MTDTILQQKIEALQARIISWGRRCGFYEKTHFTSYQEYIDDEPTETDACITMLARDTELGNFLEFSSVEAEFRQLISQTEFYYELDTEGFIRFFPKDEDLNKQYLDYFEWQWISHLIKPDYTNLYQEIFDYFKSNPKKLYFLSPQQFEILISEIFRNQGYSSELGSGWKDGGVDLRLYQKDEIDQIVTLVQIKKYKDTLPINLESVAYLQAIVDNEKANRGLFITTSRYLPQAKNFALRQNKKLILSDTNDLIKWCENVKTKIVRDKSEAISDRNILDLLSRQDGLVGKVVVGRDKTIPHRIQNIFCIIVKDASYASLLMRVHTHVVNPNNSFSGYEIPKLDETILQCKRPENVFRVKKIVNDGGDLSFWGRRTLFDFWEGEPKFFDTRD